MGRAKRFENGSFDGSLFTVVEFQLLLKGEEGQRDLNFDDFSEPCSDPGNYIKLEALARLAEEGIMIELLRTGVVAMTMGCVFAAAFIAYKKLEQEIQIPEGMIIEPLLKDTP